MLESYWKEVCRNFDVEFTESSGEEKSGEEKSSDESESRKMTSEVESESDVCIMKRKVKQLLSSD